MWKGSLLTPGAWERALRPSPVRPPRLGDVPPEVAAQSPGASGNSPGEAPWSDTTRLHRERLEAGPNHPLLKGPSSRTQMDEARFKNRLVTVTSDCPPMPAHAYQTMTQCT